MDTITIQGKGDSRARRGDKAVSSFVLNTEDQKIAARSSASSSLAYRTLVLFSVLYFVRPEDLIPGLGFIHVARITGGIAFLALLFSVSLRERSDKWPTELKLLIGLFLWECLTVPFAWWIGGALSTVLTKCSKTIIVAYLVSFAVTSVDQLRRLLFVQAASVAVMTLASVFLYTGGRMSGVLGGVFDNPNDLAINIALNWPLCLMFLIAAKGPMKKLMWGAGLLVMLRGLMLTYSRTGFLAIVVAIAFCLYEFGVRGKRLYILAAALLCGLFFVVAVPQNYGQRVQSIFGEPLHKGDSQESRKELLTLSWQATIRRPIFGLGPGNFQSYTRTWHVTHNTYTELSSECGVPALILFLLVIKRAFTNLAKLRKLSLYTQSMSVRLCTGALWASLASYLIGAFFASTAYQLFPYFMVAYTTALYRIASRDGESGHARAQAWSYAEGTGERVPTT